MALKTAISHLEGLAPVAKDNLLATLGGAALFLAICLYLLYRAALPKPIPGIPYNVTSARNILGDVPAMASHIKETGGTFTTYMANSVSSLNAPLVQIFIKPFSKPLLVLSDFREAQDLLLYRNKDFDRAPSSGDLVRGIMPDHHLLRYTDAGWKTQRRLVSDLMTPSFLNNVAGPVIYRETQAMIALWREKSRIAMGKAWVASEDIDHLALDAIMVFAFGDSFAHSATRPVLEHIKSLGAQTEGNLRRQGAADDPLAFPHGPVDKVVQAMLDVSATCMEVQGTPLPNAKWAWVNRKPSVMKATKIKEDCIKSEIQGAINRQLHGEEGPVKSGVDCMVVREQKMAEKDGRKPNYFSRVMIDEVFGFILGGHDTTSTTVCWGLKNLTDNGPAQTRLRKALRATFTDAVNEGRNPTIEEITTQGSHIPYLDAVMEEILRLSATVPVVDRQAMVDTEILGHRIPKGAVVSCLIRGPSMTSPGFAVDERRRSAHSQTLKQEARDKAWDVNEMSAYKPERWLIGGEKGDEEFDAAAGPQLAFGLGTRQCFGKRLAYLQMKILLTLIVWNFELLPCPPALSGYDPLLVMTNRPKYCYVRLGEIQADSA